MARPTAEAPRAAARGRWDVPVDRAARGLGARGRLLTVKRGGQLTALDVARGGERAAGC